MDEKSDEDLLLGFSRGESGNFDTLFGRYDVSIYGYIKRNVRNDYIAQDLTQSMWEKLIKNSDEIANKILSEDVAFSLRPYVFRMATNLINDFYRAKETKLSGSSKAFEDFENPESVEPMAKEDLSTSRGLALDDLGECIERRMVKLKADVRQTFEITRDVALSYSEAAEVLGISPESVRSRVKKVLKLIRPCLEEYKYG